MESTDTVITGLLSERNEKAFEQVFKSHFKNLHAYAATILKDDIMAEEMVQNVFFKMWEKNTPLSIPGSITAYLYRAVHNESLNYMKHQKVKAAYQAHNSFHTKNTSESASKKILFKELSEKLHQALNELPEQCRTVFQLSRFEELRYREIADQLNISVKTVENHRAHIMEKLHLHDVAALTRYAVRHGMVG
jgi:RNA polymerase sigma-70 factor (ECF subfamily)